MKLQRFSPPALVDDFGSPALLKEYSDHIADDFNRSIAAAQAVLAKHQAGQCQFYNPVTHGITDPDTLAAIVWNGFCQRSNQTDPGRGRNLN